MEQLCAFVVLNDTDQPLVVRMKRKPDTVLVECGVVARQPCPQSWWHRLLGRAPAYSPGYFHWMGELWPLCAASRDDFYWEPTEGVRVELGWGPLR